MVYVISGKNALGKLFVTARHLYSNGISSVYVKRGSYDNAVSDFYSLKPSRVRTKQVQGKVQFSRTDKVFKE